jgi:hypothetical protein
MVCPARSESAFPTVSGLPHCAVPEIFVCAIAPVSCGIMGEMTIRQRHVFGGLPGSLCGDREHGELKRDANP